ncbi:hypothetical protein [Solibacillus cecembensis]
MKMTVGIAKNVTEIPKMIQGNMYGMFGYLVVMFQISIATLDFL